jgi:hypothetical protein
MNRIEKKLHNNILSIHLYSKFFVHFDLSVTGGQVPDVPSDEFTSPFKNAQNLDQAFCQKMKPSSIKKQAMIALQGMADVRVCQ